jgi:Flp pilus assembly protein TadG
MTETVILLPIFFFIVFGLLQVAQLGLALVMVNYAASSIARTAASEKNFSTETPGVAVGSIDSYGQKASNLMVAGMQMDGSSGLIGCLEQSDVTVPTGELVVLVRAQLSAWPFIGYILNGIFGNQYATQPLSCGDLTNAHGFGPFNYSPNPLPTFFVTGTGKVRLNYKT